MALFKKALRLWNPILPRGLAPGMLDHVWDSDIRGLRWPIHLQPEGKIY